MPTAEKKNDELESVVDAQNKKITELSKAVKGLVDTVSALKGELQKPEDIEAAEIIALKAQPWTAQAGLKVAGFLPVGENHEVTKDGGEYAIVSGMILEGTKQVNAVKRVPKWDAPKRGKK